MNTRQKKHNNRVLESIENLEASGSITIVVGSPKSEQKEGEVTFKNVTFTHSIDAAGDCTHVFNPILELIIKDLKSYLNKEQ